MTDRRQDERKTDDQQLAARQLARCGSGEADPWAFTASDQRTLMFVLAVSATVILSTFLAKGGFRGGLVPVSRPVQFDVAGGIDLNQCDWPELCLLPGISRTLAQRIVDTRGAHGGFSSIDELGLVEGIGPKTIARLTPLLQIDGRPCMPPPPDDR